MAGLVGLRPSLLRQVVPERAVLDAGSRSTDCHEGRFTDTPLGLAYGASTPRLTHIAAGCGTERSCLSLGVGLARIRARADEAVTRETESASSPFGSGRPLRPCLVVNPGEGAAAPWASWPQPSSENNFPAAAQLPR